MGNCIRKYGQYPTRYSYRKKKNFMNRNLFAKELRPKVDKWDLMKLKSFCIAKETIK